MIEERDILAEQMLMAIISSQAHSRSNGTIPVNAASAKEMARYAYIYADALLEVRKQEGR